MKSLKAELAKFCKKYWDEAMVYAFTIPCVFLGDYIMHKTRPEVGWFPFLSSVVVSAIICLAVEVMTGNDTVEKRLAKRRNLPKRLLFSGVAGVASSVIVPSLVKSVMASMGIEV